MNDRILKETTPQKHKQFALDNSFIRMPNRLSAPALKIFYHLLTKISWKEENPKDAIGLLKVNTSINEIRKAIGTESRDYRFYIDMLDELQTKAWIKIDEEFYYRKTIVMPDVEVVNNQEIHITLNQSLYKFLERLYKNFTVFELANTSKFRSRFALILYVNLCSHMDHSKDRKDPLSETTWRYTTKQLKEMFDLSPDDYCNKDGKFKRTHFEQLVIDRAVEEINSKDCGIVVRWAKEKAGKFVKCYVFTYCRSDVERDSLTGEWSY